MSFTAARPPSVAAVQWLCTVAATVLIPHPLTVALSLCGAAGFLWAVGASRRGLWRLLPFAAVIALTNPLFVHEGDTVLCTLGSIPYTLEALAYGVNTAAMLTAVMLWCHAFSAVLTADRLMLLGGRRAPRLMLTLCMARRWLPLFGQRLGEVRLARRSLGLLDGKYRLRGEAEALLAVMSRSLESAILSARSMEARGYTLTGHTAFAPRKRDGGDDRRLWLTVAAAAVTATMTASFSWYPHLGAVGTAAGDLLAYGAAAVLFFMPMLFEGKERWQWRSCRSTI